MFNISKNLIILSLFIQILLPTIIRANTSNNNEVQPSMIYDQKQVQESIIKIAKKKIYFGHQSVGYNIIDGIIALKARYNLKDLLIQETNNPSIIKKPMFAHSPNGENMKPETKINNFKETITNGMGKTVDMAFFKFCYVDITASTEINALFVTYKKTMDDLIKSHPNVKFIHITVPVTAENNGIIQSLKSLIKKIIGRSTGSEDNIKRMEFNRKLISAYGNNVFDLARFESTKQDRKTITSDSGGTPHYSLLPEYTFDGGHLNPEGAQFVAYNFIRFLAKH
jgi:hypothetical protein